MRKTAIIISPTDLLTHELSRHSCLRTPIASLCGCVAASQADIRDATHSVQNTGEFQLSPKWQILSPSVWLDDFFSWEMFSVATSSLSDGWPARDLTRSPTSSTPGWDELVIKFQRQLGYDPSVSTFFSCSVSGLQCPGSMLGIILHCPHSQTSESGVTVSREKFIDFWDNWGCKPSDKWFIASDIDTSHLAQFRQKQIEVKLSNSGQMKDNFVPGRVGRPPLGYGRIFITFQLMARSFRLSQVIWTLISSLTSSVSLLPGSLIQSILSGGGDGIRSSRSHCGHVSAASLVTAPH